MTSLEQHISTLQRQIDQLASQVAALRTLTASDQLHADKYLVDKPVQQPRTHVSSVGISRFRQLQES